MRLTRTLAATACALALGGLSACGGGGSSDQSHNAPPSLTTSPTAASSSAPAKPRPTGVPTYYPAVGLRFTKLPKATGSTKAAIEAYVAGEVGIERSITTLKLDPAVTRLTGADVLEGTKNNIAYLKQHHQRYTGAIKIAVTDIAGASQHIVVLDTCVDASGQRLASTNGGPTKPLNGDAVGTDRIQLSLIDSQWKFTSETFKGGSC